MFPPSRPELWYGMASNLRGSWDYVFLVILLIYGWVGPGKDVLDMEFCCFLPSSLKTSCVMYLI